MREDAIGVLAIADTNDNDVSLVTLDLLQCLDIEWLCLVAAEEVLQILLQLPGLRDFFLDNFPLTHAERDHQQ